MSRVLGGPAAAVRLGRLTLVRLVRGKLLWISAVVALAPLVPLVLLAEHVGARNWREVFTMLTVLLTVVPAMHVAPAVGEEVEDRTFTYLWSRPFPRWALLAGKLMALVPAVSLLLAVTVGLAFAVTFRGEAAASVSVLAQGLLATAAAVVAASAISLGLGALLPRHATAAAILYLLLLDTPIGALPFAVQSVTVSYHVRTLAQAGSDGVPPASLAWLAGITAVWLAVAVWRVSVAEYATDR